AEQFLPTPHATYTLEQLFQLRQVVEPFEGSTNPSIGRAKDLFPTKAEQFSRLSDRPLGLSLRPPLRPSLSHNRLVACSFFHGHTPPEELCCQGRRVPQPQQDVRRRPPHRSLPPRPALTQPLLHSLYYAG